SDRDVPPPTVARGAARCLACSGSLLRERVRSQLREQGGGANVVLDRRGCRTGGARLVAVVSVDPGRQTRHYRVATELDYQPIVDSNESLRRVLASSGHEPSAVPDEALPPERTLGFRVQPYGMARWRD